MVIYNDKGQPVKLHYSNSGPPPKHVKTFAVDYINREAYKRLQKTLRGQVYYIQWNMWKKDYT